MSVQNYNDRYSAVKNKPVNGRIRSVNGKNFVLTERNVYFSFHKMAGK